MRGDRIQVVRQQHHMKSPPGDVSISPLDLLRQMHEETQQQVSSARRDSTPGVALRAVQPGAAMRA